MAAGGKLERLATGFSFVEGPIWMPDGSLHFSDMPADLRRRWHPIEGVSILRDPSNKCNGMTIDNSGALIVCEHTTSSVVRELPDGSRETIASHWDGHQLNSPNDVIVARDGSILFTDPTFGRMPVFGEERDQELSIQGVYRLLPTNELQLLYDKCSQPNGLCLSPDETRLYVNDTARAHVLAFTVGQDWQLGDPFELATGIESTADSSRPDGMKTDERGNIYVTGPGGIWILRPNGTRIGVIGVPEPVSNMNWGERDWRSLFITATSSVYRIRLNARGNRLGYTT